jgi:hypothetical protein
MERAPVPFGHSAVRFLADAPFSSAPLLAGKEAVASDECQVMSGEQGHEKAASAAG